jgi:tryptophan-rich sensory protein
MKKNRFLMLVISLLLPQLAGGIGAVFTASSVTGWYQQLNRPSFAPPNWLFAPVWTLLYLLMGISLFLVWQQGNARKAIILFFIQLGLNSLWSIIFFGLKQPFFAFVELVVLWVFILLTILEFAKIKNLAAWLLVPYLAWVTFAGILNFAIFWLNR